jgi:hypothetical protein
VYGLPVSTGTSRVLQLRLACQLLPSSNGQLSQSTANVYQSLFSNVSIPFFWTFSPLLQPPSAVGLFPPDSTSVMQARSALEFRCCLDQTREGIYRCLLSESVLELPLSDFSVFLTGMPSTQPRVVSWTPEEDKRLASVVASCESGVPTQLRTQ